MRELRDEVGEVRELVPRVSDSIIRKTGPMNAHSQFPCTIRCWRNTPKHKQHLSLTFNQSSSLSRLCFSLDDQELHHLPLRMALIPNRRPREAAPNELRTPFFNPGRDRVWGSEAVRSRAFRHGNWRPILRMVDPTKPLRLMRRRRLRVLVFRWRLCRMRSSDTGYTCKPVMKSVQYNGM